MTNLVWKTPEQPGLTSLEDVSKNLISFLSEHGWDDIDIVVGTDSQVYGRITRFVTAICVHHEGHGGQYWYQKSDTMRDRSLPLQTQKKLRIFEEVERSIAISGDLSKCLGMKVKIHIDASPAGRKEFTSSFSDQLRGYATGCGFEAFVKPDSWAASVVANRHTKVAIGHGVRATERRLRRQIARKR